MGLKLLSFLRDWTNPADFPTVEPDEATVRADLQYHPDAIKDYINETLIPSHDSLTYAKHSHNNKTVLDGITDDDVVKWRGTIGTFRVNVTYSDGVYSADKTFDEIKAAYEAGQQPYVVYGGGTIYTLSSSYFASEQMFMDFERYLIWEDTLKTETLRIYSYALANGSNIEQRISAFNVPNGTTYIKVDSTGDVITTVNGETYADIQALINAGKPVVVRYNDVLDFYYFETFEFSDSSGTHHRVNFRCDMGSIVYTLALRDDNTWVFSETSLQSKSITDKGGYFTTDTVEGALQEIGAHLNADTPYIYKTHISESLAAGAIYFVTEEKVSLIQAALLDNRPVVICADSTADNKRVYYVISRCNAIPTESSVANISLYFASLEGSYEATITIENNSGALQFTRSI